MGFGGFIANLLGCSLQGLRWALAALLSSSLLPQSSCPAQLRCVVAVLRGRHVTAGRRLGSRPRFAGKHARCMVALPLN